MSWLSFQLCDLAKFRSGGTPSKSRPEFWSGGIPWVSPKDMSGRDITDSVDHITEAATSHRNTDLVPPGTVLMVVRSGILVRRVPVGIARRPLAINQDLKAILPNSSVLTSEFLTYYLSSQEQNLLSGFVKRGATVHSIVVDKLRRMQTPMPALSEQRRIVEILDQADALRQQRVDADKKAESVVFALFHHLFGDPATNSMGWPTEVLDEKVVDFRYGTSVRCEATYDGLPVLRIPNVVRGTLDLSDLKHADLPTAEANRLRLESGDVLFVRTNGNRDYVGRCSVFNLVEPYLFASYLIRGRFDKSKFLPDYLATCLSLPAGRAMLAKSIRTTAGQSNISVKGLRELVLPRPPIELQQGFSERLIALNRLRASQLSNTERVNRLFTVLLNRAFTGQLTAGWRERHKSELEAELREQLAALDQSAREPERGRKRMAVRP